MKSFSRNRSFPWVFLKITEQKNQCPKNSCWNSTYVNNHRLACNFNKKDVTVEVVLRIPLTSCLRVLWKAVFMNISKRLIIKHRRIHWDFSLQLYKNWSHLWIFLKVFAYFPGISIWKNAFNLHCAIIFKLKSWFTH